MWCERGRRLDVRCPLGSGPRMAVPADAVEVVRALHQDAATVQVGHGSERRHCNATPSALVRERRAPPRRTEHGLARAPSRAALASGETRPPVLGGGGTLPLRPAAAR